MVRYDKNQQKINNYDVQSAWEVSDIMFFKMLLVNLLDFVDHIVRQLMG